RPLRDWLFNGTRAIGTPVQIDAAGGDIVIRDPVAPPRTVARDQISVDAPIAGSRRLLRLPNGELIETENSPLLDSLWPSPGGFNAVGYALESRWWAVVLGLALAAVVVWITVADLLPLAADPASRLISPRVERILGE